MAKPLLILVHGMGAHSAEWAAGPIGRLIEIAATYPTLSDRGPLDDQVAFASVRYDPVFEDLLARWDEEGDRVDQLLAESRTRLPRVAAVLRDGALPPDERSFLWTHVLDPVFYRAVEVVRDEVRTLVLAQMVSAINRHLGAHPGARISVLGHSLGSVVLHDALHALGTGAAAEHSDAFRSDRFRFNSVYQISNASRFGPRRLVDINPYDSVTRPLSAGPCSTGDGPCAEFFFNIRNRWDPITWWQRFMPRGWGGGYFDVEVGHLHQVNAHGLLHYLSHPDVHVTLFRGLLGAWSVPEQEWHAQLADFPELDFGDCAAAGASFLHELDRLRQAAEGRHLDDVALGLLHLYRTVKSARDSCSGLFNESDGWL